MSYRYFLALFPNAVERDQCARVVTGLQPLLALRGTCIDASKLHLTLHFLGRYENENAALETAVTTTCSWIEADRFTLTFDRASSLAARRAVAPCVLEPTVAPPALRAFADQLQAATGIARDQEFRPHVTWLHSRDRIAIPVNIAAMTWSCESFSLVRSAPDRYYRILRTWRLL
ncbi:MAG: 2'-5' RNA ligase family protein [Tahibacter sp.]